MSQVIVRRERRVIIIQGHYNNDQEHDSFIHARVHIGRYFTSIIGGAFDSTDIIQITNKSYSLEKLNDTINNLTVDVAIFVFLGHGAIQDGKQIFQLSETELIYPGQLNYKAKKTLVLVDSCRGGEFQGVTSTPSLADRQMPYRFFYAYRLANGHEPYNLHERI